MEEKDLKLKLPMDSEGFVKVEKIVSVDLKPNDVLVVEISKQTALSMRSRIKEVFGRLFKSNRIVIVEKGQMDFTIISEKSESEVLGED